MGANVNNPRKYLRILSGWLVRPMNLLYIPEDFAANTKHI